MSGGRERGSVLLLLPAGVLALFVLGALAVDAAIVFLAERELASATAAAANDAATIALAERSFYDCGRLELDAARAGRVAGAAFANRRAAFLDLVGPPQVQVRADGRSAEVTVTAKATVDVIFAAALPGGIGTYAVDATTTVTAERDPLLPAPPSC